MQTSSPPDSVRESKPERCRARVQHCHIRWPTTSVSDWSMSEFPDEQRMHVDVSAVLPWVTLTARTQPTRSASMASAIHCSPVVTARQAFDSAAQQSATLLSLVARQRQRDHRGAAPLFERIAHDVGQLFRPAGSDLRRADRASPDGAAVREAGARR